MGTRWVALRIGCFAVVRVTKLCEDSVLATERWFVKNGSFYLNSTQSLPLYDASLTHDTTWGVHGSSISYSLMRVLLFGSNRSAQSLLDRYVNITFSESTTLYKVALGVGIFCHYYHTWGGETYSWTETSTLIGLLKDGRLYGDSLLTSVGNKNGFGPLTFRLEQNYPNPFNSSTKIKFQIPGASHATLKIYNSVSHVVATLMDAILAAGEHQVIFTAAGLSSGVYFCRLESGPIVLTRKMLLME